MVCTLSNMLPGHSCVQALVLMRMYEHMADHWDTDTVHIAHCAWTPTRVGYFSFSKVLLLGS